MCSKSKTRDCTKFFILIQLESIAMSVRPSKRPYLCLSVSPYELLLTYCYTTKNLRNYAFVGLFKEIFVFKDKRLNCWISGATLNSEGFYKTLFSFIV